MPTFVNNFLVPLIQIIFMAGFFGGLATWITWTIWKAWKKTIKFFFKYSIFRKKFSESDIKWIVEALEQGMDYVDVKKLMLVSGQSEDRINEIIWIFNKFYQEFQKEVNNGRSSQRNTRKNQSTTELPSKSSSSSI